MCKHKYNKYLQKQKTKKNPGKLPFAIQSHPQFDPLHSYAAYRFHNLPLHMHLLLDDPDLQKGRDVSQRNVYNGQQQPFSSENKYYHIIIYQPEKELRA